MFTPTDMDLLGSTALGPETSPTLATFQSRDLSHDPFFRVDVCSIDLDQIQPLVVGVPRVGQSLLPSSLAQLKTVDLSAGVHELDFGDYHFAYLFQRNAPWLDTDSTIGITTSNNELLAIASMILFDGHVIVTQIQGSITEGVDFNTGLTYAKAKRLISGFDWRSTLLACCENIAVQTRNTPSVLPNARSQWPLVREQFKHTMSYDALANENGYQYSTEHELFIKPTFSD
ncbi:MAG: hypothetical protein Q7T41_00625 [Candidatus Saccharibacteria bacterium]|nr:hypothetical protein [Candidatus Saccharibacteria bacterium]